MCQLVGKVFAFVLVVIIIPRLVIPTIRCPGSNLVSRTPITAKIKQYLRVFSPQVVTRLAFSAYIVLARSSPDSLWWGQKLGPMNLVIPLIGIHLTAPLWGYLLGKIPTKESLVKAIGITFTLASFLLLLGTFVPEFKGELMALAVMMLVSTDILFDLMTERTDLSPGLVATQKRMDSLLVPLMRLLLSAHLFIGKGLNSDPVILWYHSILMVASVVSLAALLIWEYPVLSKTDHEKKY